MINELLRFTHAFNICGDNDVNSLGVEDIYRNYEFVIKALYPRIVRISGFLPRADFEPSLRTRYNLFLAEKLKDRYKSPKLIKRTDLDANGRDRFHLRHTQNGPKHMMQKCPQLLN